LRIVDVEYLNLESVEEGEYLETGMRIGVEIEERRRALRLRMRMRHPYWHDQRS
jgi:hypothetical protein